MVRTATPETILGFLLVQINCISKLNDVADWLIYSTNVMGVSVSPSEDSVSSSSSGPAVKSHSGPTVFTMADEAMKEGLLFSFLEGNKFPDSCGWVTFDLPAVVVFGSKGSLDSAYLSNLQTTRSKSE